ncbi:MAG: hypothetical protein DRI88_09890 [Bacteroidetes bacterium]|nr:MAG: hypothetical protein DRI72_07950 [Bacteroidota bacterium]RLD44250.1 MAG: hypothetical protein DRI88_09890 [Bacteroidota bacterium]RLD73077.1 MAG: hypothetical protein DRI87_04935 [Bacteroidota bacterium]RLD85552.1 MAG: hypothetical protein DRJ02_10185 [Bacteroidota bacterium]
MKKINLFLFVFFIFETMLAQAPQSFNYQAVARNSDGTAITNSPIGLKLSIRSGNANGTTIYSESFTPVSNAIGVFTVNIGEGNPLSGTFADINWGADKYFLNVAIDPAGGSNYIDMGTTQFVSVPYSLYTASIYVNYSNDTLYIGDQYVVLTGGGSGGDVTDYDGNTYETVTIGSQTWLKQNLRSLHYADGTPIDSVWAYNNNESNVATWGRLYNWNAAMHGASSSNGNPSGVQGACPDGWHLPSKAEFEELVGFVGGGVGWKLKETGSTYWEEPNSNTNETGFSARGSGERLIEGQFQSLKETTNFWSATEQDNLRASNMILYSNQGGAPIHSDNKKVGFSIRCIKN